MKSITVLLFAFAQCTLCLAQTNVSSGKQIVAFEIYGQWKNIQYKTPGNSKVIGNVHDKSAILPQPPVLENSFIKILTDGNFVDLRYPNAKWELKENHLIVTTQFGDRFKAFITRDDSTHIYRLTLGGQTFEKKLF